MVHGQFQRNTGDWGHCTPMNWTPPYMWICMCKSMVETFVVGSLNGSVKPPKCGDQKSSQKIGPVAVDPTGIRTGVSYPWPTWRLGCSSDCWVSGPGLIALVVGIPGGPTDPSGT